MTDKDNTNENEMATRVVAAVVRREGAWLVCQRAPTKRYGGLWEFPGGKVEAGEDDAAALCRELKEELAVAVRRVGPPLLTARDPGSAFLVVFFEVEIEGTPVPREHSAVRWATVDALRRLALAPTDQCFVTTLTRASLAEDVKDLAAFDARARELSLAFENALNDLKRRGKL